MDYLVLLNQALLEDPAAGPPTSNEEIVELMIFLDHDRVSPYVTEDYSKTRILVRHDIAATETLKDMSQRVRDFLDENLDAGLRATITGDSMLTLAATASMINGQLQSVLLILSFFILIVAFSWFFKRSTIGVSMRAVSDDQLASMSVGISVPKVFGLAWAMAGLSAAAAGGIIGNITGLNFETLRAFGITVFPVVILGGLDSIIGAVVAGIIMGLIQQFAAGYLDGNWGLNGTADVLPYIILLVILLFKPHGLFGTHEIERV